MSQTAKLRERAVGYRWVVIGMWLLCGVFGFMTMSTLGILLPAISSDLGLSPSQQGLLGSSTFFGSLVLGVPMSWWTSRFAPKVLTTITLALGAFFLFFQGWAPAFAILLAGRLGFGIVMLAREPARALLILQWFPRREVVLVNSVSNVLFGLVVGGGMVATPFIMEYLGHSWRSIFYIFSAILAILTLVWVVLGREQSTGEYQSLEVSKEKGLLKGTLSYPDLWVGGFGFLGANLAWSAFLTFFLTLMLDRYQIPLQWSGAILALGILVGGISGLGVGYAVMTFDKRKSILKTLGVLMTGTYVGMVLVNSISLLAFLSLLNGIAWGFWPILHTVPFQLSGIRPRQVAVALAITMTLISTGSVVGPLVTGLLAETMGDLRLALVIVSFASLSLSVAGMLLNLGTTGVSVHRLDAAHHK